jgi:hypothetical protein
MKRLIFLLILSLLNSFGYSQRHSQSITHYLFPQFAKGVVLMKTGIKNEALLNFNSLTEEMIFDNGGKKLAIDQIEKIDTIYISDRKFFPLNGKFLELIYHSKYDLYAEHKCKLKDPGKPSGYGGSTQTGASSSYSTFFSGSQVYDIKLPESFETISYTFYWLKKDNGELIKFVSLRQLPKIFFDKSGQVKKYIRDNNVSYDDTKSMAGLVKFLESH